MLSKKIDRNERYMIKGALRRNGFDHWRIVTSGIGKNTGSERTFFIDFLVVNPSLTPNDCSLGFKSRFGKSAADLQYALAGTESAKDANSETYVQPSFVMIKAGLYGENGKQINAYFPVNSVEFGKTDFIMRTGDDPRTSCILGTDFTQGVVQVTKTMLNESPELLGQSGTMGWNIKFEKQLPFAHSYKSRKNNWNVIAGKNVTTGTIVMDGEEFSVIPEKSFGYYDKIWGKEFSSPYFHLSASNLVSIISGKHLSDSCFAVQGEFNGAVSILAHIDGQQVEFHADKSRKYNLNYDCIEMPEDEEGVKLHWTVSVSDHKKVLDIDIFCNAREMFVKDLECPEGGRKLLKILGGGSGTGEIRLYNKIKKNLELIEHARIEKALCEYGNIELPED